MKKQISSVKLASLIFSVSVLCFAIVSLSSAAWTTPTLAPPEGNAPAPLNVGNVLQYKIGPLIINYGNGDGTGYAAYGFSIPYGRTGIGTLTPQTTLDIKAPNTALDSFGTMILSSTDSTAINKGGQLDFGGAYTGTSVTYLASIAGRKENSTNLNVAGYLQFSTRNGSTLLNTEKMRIDSNGKVGIGTTAPAARLHILYTPATASDYGLIMDASGGGLTTGNASIKLAGDGGYSEIIMSRSGLGSATLNNALVFRNTTLNANILFQTGGGNTRMVVDGSGNVGIGSSSQFQVNSTGDLVKINNVAYSWPSAQGGTDTYLKNNGSGGLSWAAGTTGVSGTATIYADNGLTGGGVNLNTFHLAVGQGSGISVTADAVSHGNTSPNLTGQGISSYTTNNTGTKFIQNITIDKFGHITSITSAELICPP